MGRLLFGPDWKPGFWEGNIWSSECSQRFLDPYSLSHLAHGLIFYFLLWSIANRLSLTIPIRYLIALAAEAAWELLENSPLIINRYREATISLGYCGDSILNSLSDLLMMSLGFILAWKIRPWISLSLLFAMESACALAYRDNLTLNVIMLIHPVDDIKSWQMGGH
jgi:hypothetical protein